MATPSLNGTAIPSTMSTRGVYKFATQMTGSVNGQGEAVLAGPQSVMWKFSSMTQAEWDWWTTTLLAGAASLTLTAAELWDHTKTEQAFTSGIVYLPIYETYRGGMYWNVVVKISHLLPLILS